MKTKFNLTPAALAVAGAAVLFAGPALAVFDLTNKGFVQYGDGQSYSLPVLQLQQCGKFGPNCDFFVNSQPGQIKGLTVLGTGPSGTDVVTNFAGMDNAYATPNASGIPFWRTDPGSFVNGTQMPAGAWNGDNSWDTTLAALKTYLGTEQMVFFFNNNQEKSGGTYNQSLAAWAQISIRDATGAVVSDVGFKGVYDFSNVNSAYKTVAEGGGGVLNGSVGGYTSSGLGNPIVGDRANTDYVLSGGQLCLVLVDFGAGVTDPKQGDLLDCSSVAKNDKRVEVIDHNLGANEAAYAVVFPELNAQLKALFGSGLDLSTYTMSVDIRLGCDPNDYDGNGPDQGLTSDSTICNFSDSVNGYGRNLNNGFEQIFISTARDVVNVPEPGTLLLTGLALLGLAGLRRRAG